MKGEWIGRCGSGTLLLFFNGWGMDRRVAESFAPRLYASGERDIAVLYDYSTLVLPDSIARAAAGAESVELLAWSMGVWAAAGAGLGRVDRAVALNGTPWPRDSERGIPPELFTGTLEGWNDANRQRFERRMMSGSVPQEVVESVRSQRSSGDQKAELQAIADLLSDGQLEFSAGWRYSKAVIGGRDQVFRVSNQRRAWQEMGVPVVEYPAMPHFPFHQPEVLKKLLA